MTQQTGYPFRMENSLNSSATTIRDHHAEWIGLGDQVRARMQEILAKAAGSELESDLQRLNADTMKICDHVDRIHRDAKRMLIELDERLPEIDSIPEGLDIEEVQREAIQIQRETHELRADFKDIIKALFMWRDDPEERVRDKH